MGDKLELKKEKIVTRSIRLPEWLDNDLIRLQQNDLKLWSLNLMFQTAIQEFVEKHKHPERYAMRSITNRVSKKK